MGHMLFWVGSCGFTSFVFLFGFITHPDNISFGGSACEMGIRIL
ncbi:unnamed protein product [Brassica napus]|uniref:(rape) hypothetical protein n=1 Tax=Brassica napus TaxID=3708 RepID=A0A816KXU7_BRANA|nr:unnamed protein product [Brassica napus]